MQVITVAAEILSELPVGKFLIKLNHRKLLDAIFEICGVPAEKFRPICSAVDKLDKAPWAEVKMVATASTETWFKFVNFGSVCLFFLYRDDNSFTNVQLSVKARQK